MKSLTLHIHGCPRACPRDCSSLLLVNLAVVHFDKQRKYLLTSFSLFLKEVDGSREPDVESGVCDDATSASDDEGADETTKLLPIPSTTKKRHDASATITNRTSSSATAAPAAESASQVPDLERQPEVMRNCTEVVVRVVREAGTGLGISIAGGIGSMPYKDNDKVSHYDFNRNTSCASVIESLHVYM